MRKSWLVLWLVVCSSCAAQIDQKMKTAVLLSPEASGAGRFGGGAGVQGAPMVTITDDVKRRPPDTAVSYVEQQSRIFLQGSAGIIDRLEVIVDPASWINGKYQILGEPFTRSVKGNFSLSVIGSFYAEKRRDDNSPVIHLAGDKYDADVKFEKKMFAWRGGLLAGYRTSDWFMVYAGANFQRHRYHGTFDILGGRKGSFAGMAQAKAALLGVEFSFDRNYAARIEDVYSVATISAFGAKSSQHSLGLLFAGYFGAVTPAPVAE